VRAHEPRILVYEAYLSRDGARMTVFQVHPDPESMDTHLKVAGPSFAPLELLVLKKIELFGTPTDGRIASLRRKAELLGGATLEIHDRLGGLERFAGEGSDVRT
jgi:hypothetical protein